MLVPTPNKSDPLQIFDLLGPIWPHRFVGDRRHLTPSVLQIEDLLGEGHQVQIKDLQEDLAGSGLAKKEVIGRRERSMIDN